MRTRIGLGFAFFLAQVACTGSVFSNPDAGVPPTDDDAGNVHGGGGSDAGAGVDAAPPPGCDTTKLPNEDKCVINDAQGVFVSSSMGSATGDGTQAKPLASLDAAIVLAKQSHKRVYACAETYAESIHFESGVDVFGYLVCSAGWATSTSHAKVASPTSPAATATNITTATRVDSVDLYAPDFTASAQSSIALIASGSPALTIKNATIHAGTGGNGANGAAGIPLQDSSSTKNGKNAHPFDVCTGGIGHCSVAVAQSIAGGTNSCSGEVGHDPGPGGDGGWDGRYQSLNSSWATSGQATTAGYPTVATTQTAKGGVLGKLGNGPSVGANGANGVDGASGSAFGVLDASGYVVANGTPGTDGAPGQGGGGAGGMGLTTTMVAASAYDQKYGHGEAGASGGAGGCPGLAATAGQGGGASIAVVAIVSPFTLDTVTIESSSGGAGGTAGQSSPQTSGGPGGTNAGNTFDGARGGDGGLAGVSGNGGGGPSIGIAHQGTAPTKLGSTTKTGSGGLGIPPSTDSASGKAIPASADGVTADDYAF